ncbi:cation-transporting P-type ATPase B domain protein [Mycobacterium ulcerans str. Harvey]|uniref:Cation-transporting P-type ATPase B domain protein n=1 Tax=Mycobacterium ulcerans str. Harvey TaxID=1299332 RepID=A0ABN0RAL5_MYCUL|nr:cation-transporting P-type ATPase B domain protein [Mycobacterium ulcerans str. Harvey]
MAIGRGTDVAIGAADIILVRDDLHIVGQALDLREPRCARSERT